MEFYRSKYATFRIYVRNREVKTMLLKLFSISIGVIFIIFSKPFGRFLRKYQQDVVGTETTDKKQMIWSIIAGAFFIGLSFFIK
jgi:hypothetical protein